MTIARAMLEMVDNAGIRLVEKLSEIMVAWTDRVLAGKSEH